MTDAAPDPTPDQGDQIAHAIHSLTQDLETIREDLRDAVALDGPLAPDASMAEHVRRAQAWGRAGERWGGDLSVVAAANHEAENYLAAVFLILTLPEVPCP